MTARNFEDKTQGMNTENVYVQQDGGEETQGNPTLCRTTASISRPRLGQVTKCTLTGLTGI